MVWHAQQQPIKKLCGSKSKSHILEEQKQCVENESCTNRKQNDIRVILIIYRYTVGKIIFSRIS